MAQKTKDTLPKYQQVAIGIAKRIESGQYHVGEKLHSRSTLANAFKVSPETARKAINVLVDLDIVSVKHGSGVFVSSQLKAGEFLKKYSNVQAIKEIKQNIQQRIDKQKEELSLLNDAIDELVNQTQSDHIHDLLLPYELIIDHTSNHLNKSLSDLHLWQATAATVIAIKHENNLIISPGPYAMIRPNDTLYFVGDEYTKQRITNFFYK
ncbi:GntR family transcriptional regulator [Vagococcus vulneris]|uniref:GntR family transcriptional regulator n=1 Tax=Vagococcus vulneris TaxID=1977869 RepID=A0A429ZX33_9ENTE|nr:GntR family transcriptional regulator [Vagococcus vulneris]RST98402.1 GntR family transcriptional regulator [Vagococcus vulneris]